MLSRTLPQPPVLPCHACVLPLTALLSPSVLTLALCLLPLELPLELTWAPHLSFPFLLGLLVGGFWEEVPILQIGHQRLRVVSSKHFSMGNLLSCQPKNRLALPHTLFILLAAPSLQSSVRQRLTEPQHGLGSQRLVEGEAGHFLTSRVSLRRMRSLSSGQSFSSEGHGTSSPSASASSSCSSTTATTTTTTSITTVHVHPVNFHHSTSYFLQMEPYPDPPPSDSTAVMPGHSGSLGYQLSFFPFVPLCYLCLGLCLLAAAWPAVGVCAGGTSPCRALSQP